MNRGRAALPCSLSIPCSSILEDTDPGASRSAYTRGSLKRIMQDFHQPDCSCAPNLRTHSRLALLPSPLIASDAGLYCVPRQPIMNPAI